MAIFLNNKVGFKIATVDLSDHVTAFTLNRQADQLEVTAMGDTSHKFVTGLSADTITVSFLNDTAAASVLATIQAAYGTTVAFSAVQDATSPVTISATNKLYTGTILVDSITDINGAVGDLGTQSVTWTVNGTVVITTS